MADTEIGPILAAIADLKTDVAGVKIETVHIKDHLSKLNGSVVTHTKEIGDLKLHQVAREDTCPLIEGLKDDIHPLSDFVVAHKATDASNQRWSDRLSPVAYAAAGAGVVLILSHAKDLLAAFRP